MAVEVQTEEQKIAEEQAGLGLPYFGRTMGPAFPERSGSGVAENSVGSLSQDNAPAPSQNPS